MIASCVLFLAVVWLLFVAMESPRDSTGTVLRPTPSLAQNGTEPSQQPSSTAREFPQAP